MKSIFIICLIVGLGLTTSCDYSSYRKGKDAEKGKTENMATEKAEESSSMDTSK